MYLKSLELFEEIFINREDVQEINIDWQFPLVDEYGNENLGRVMLVTVYSLF